MFTDLARSDAVIHKNVDLCIVGAGPAGITLANELLDTGLSIVLAEAGGLSPDPSEQSLLTGQSVGHPMSLSDGRYRVFGGSATKWGGRCATLDPLDLANRPWLHHSGWPIDWDELRPFYERAMLSSNFGEIWLDDAETILKVRGARRLIRDPELREFIWRVARPDEDRRRRGKLDGYNWGTAKRERMRASEKLQVLLHANLTNLVCSRDGSSIIGARFKATGGQSAEVHARAFVLCCGGIENPRILLKLAEAGVANLEGHNNIGRFFAQHPRGEILSIRMSTDQRRRMKSSFGSFRRQGGGGADYEIGLAVSEHAQQKYGLVNASAGFYDLPSRNSGWLALKRVYTACLSQKNAPIDIGDIGAILLDLPLIIPNMWRRFISGKDLIFSRGKVTVVVDLEQDPCFNSRLFLSDERDALGERKVGIDWRISDVEMQTVRFLARRIATEIVRLDLGTPFIKSWVKRSRPGAEDLRGTYHFIGATRMASGPGDGVVDKNGKCFGLQNLFVAGSSTFPTGGHANPTLTIVALAHRLADHLKASFLEARETRLGSGPIDVRGAI